MSVHFGGVIMAAGAVAGIAFAGVLGVGQTISALFAVVGGLGVTAVAMKATGGGLAWGFGAKYGPGPAPESPKWIHEEKGTGIYEEDDGWRCVHYESGMEVQGETPQEVDDVMTEKLRDNGWYDE